MVMMVIVPGFICLPYGSIMFHIKMINTLITSRLGIWFIENPCSMKYGYDQNGFIVSNMNCRCSIAAVF